MSPYGKFTLARQELKKVALKADSINYEKRWRTTFRENIKLTMKLFDALTDLPQSFTRVKCGGLIAMDNYIRKGSNKSNSK